MQRVEMEIQYSQDNIAILFLDPIGREADRSIREAYRQIYLCGDFIKKYKHIKDSLSFELSHHSFGIQLCDYCAGIFNGVLKGYTPSIEVFRTRLRPFLRKSSEGKFMGCGIVEVPKNEQARQFLLSRICGIIHG
nr:DUF3800 domain-containing protein [Fervidobacterium changbaicum]